MSAIRWIFRINVMMIFLSMTLVGISIVLGDSMPDRGQLVYDALVNRNYDIFMLDIGLKIRHNLTRHDSLDTQAVWSPNGRYIAFQSHRDGGRWLYVMGANGGNARSLTNDPTIDQYNPIWSTDSVYIYYRAHPGVNAPIFRVRTDGSDRQPFDELAFERLFERRFDPNRFMVMSYKNGNWGIFIHGSDWDNRRQLTSNNILFRELPVWSSDDRRIAFISLDRIRSEIYVMDADGGNFQQITNDGMRKSNLSWRP